MIEDLTTLSDAAATTTRRAIRATKRGANEAVDRVVEGAEDLRAQTGTALDSVASGAEQAKQRSVAMLREGTVRLRRQSRQAAATTRGYIRDEPVKSVLIAAAGGAVLMG